MFVNQSINLSMYLSICMGKMIRIFTPSYAKSMDRSVYECSLKPTEKFIPNKNEYTSRMYI